MGVLPRQLSLEGPWCNRVCAGLKKAFLNQLTGQRSEGSATQPALRALGYSQSPQNPHALYDHTPLEMPRTFHQVPVALRDICQP